MTKQPTCADRVESEWQDRRADFQFWMEHGTSAEDLPLAELPEEEDRAVREKLEEIGDFYDYGLAFDYVAPGTFDDQREGYWRYQLSWGGPSDEIRFYSSDGETLYRAEYWFMDWFDGANVDVTDDDVTAWLWGFFADIGAVDSALAKANRE